MARDWSQLYNKYKGQWVALGNDDITVIAHGLTLKDVLAQAARLGHPAPHVTQLPSDLTIFVG